MNALALKITRNACIPLRLRKKLGKLMFRNDSEAAFRAKIFDLSYDGALGNHMDNKIYVYGLHEPATIRLSRTILQHQKQQGKSPVYMDIGTNCGLHLLCCAPMADKAFGFEPWEIVRKRAENNIQINGLKNVKIFDCAVSDQNTVMDFAQPHSNNFGVGSLAIDQLAAEYGEDKNSFTTIQTKVVSGDTIAQEHGIIPTLIKIDVEGFEKQVLRGLKQTIKSHSPAIIFEYNAISKKDFDTMDTIGEVFGNHYSVWGILRSREKPILRPFRPGKRYENVLVWPERTLPDFLS
jgi:FkbM family methyltransferase